MQKLRKIFTTITVIIGLLLFKIGKTVAVQMPNEIPDAKVPEVEPSNENGTIIAIVVTAIIIVIGIIAFILNRRKANRESK